jgi:hypothetical protein
MFRIDTYLPIAVSMTRDQHVSGVSILLLPWQTSVDVVAQRQPNRCRDRPGRARKCIVCVDHRSSSRSVSGEPCSAHVRAVIQVEALY